MASHSEEARKATEGLVAAPAKRESEKQLEEAKQARIVRLRRLLVVVGTLTFFVGLASLFYYPAFFANKTYVSENALNPHWEHLRYQRDDAHFAISFSKQYQEFQKRLSHEIRSRDETWNNITATWLVHELRQLGVDAYLHTFLAPNRTPLRMVPMHLRGPKKHAYNVQVVLRAPRSLGGQDATLLTARFPRSAGKDAALSLGFAISAMKSLEQLKWRSRDIVLILSADIYDGSGLAAWLHDHFSLQSAFKGVSEGGVQQHYTTIFGAINFDLRSQTFNSIGIRAEGSYGNLPNLDLINSIVRIGGRAAADSHQIDLYLSETVFTENLGMSSLNITFGRPHDLIPNFTENQQLFSMIANLAAGVPNGDHAYVSRYSISAVTLYSSSASSGVTSGYSASLVDLGRLVEGTLRSLHNLVEPLHQSFYFYLLPSATSYVSIGQYMISLGLLLVGFTLHPVLILLMCDRMDAVYAAVHIVIAAGVGIVVMAAPLYVASLVDALGFSYEIQSLGVHDIVAPLVWILLVFFGDILIRTMIFPLLESIRSGNSTEQQKNQTDALGAAAVVPIFVSLPIISLFNFSFAIVAAALTIALSTCLIRATSKKTPVRLLQAILLLLCSPVPLAYLSATVLDMSIFEAIELMMTNYALHSTLLYPFLNLVWLPAVIVGQKRLLSF